MLTFTLAAILVALLAASALLVQLQRNLRKAKRLRAMAEGQLGRAKRELERTRNEARQELDEMWHAKRRWRRRAEDAERELESIKESQAALESRLALAILEEKRLRQRNQKLSDLNQRLFKNELEAAGERNLLIKEGIFRRQNGRFSKAVAVHDGKLVFIEDVQRRMQEYPLYEMPTLE